jgi:hypothetical protein
MMDGLNGPETTSLIRSKCAMHILLRRHDYDLLPLICCPGLLPWFAAYD